MTARAERGALAAASILLVAVLSWVPVASAATPLVRVDARLERPSQRLARIVAVIRWNGPGIGGGMTAGDLRAVAVNSRTTVPTLLAKSSTVLAAGDAARPRRAVLTITGRARLAALRRGNRVVLTATQHKPLPNPPVPAINQRSYVTVAQLRAGPKRGRVGSVDCSDRTIGPGARPGALQYCDLVGGSLAGADLSSADLRMADITGGVLRMAGLNKTNLDGGRLAGVDASDAVIKETFLRATLAPRLAIRSTLVDRANFYGAVLNKSDFTRSTFLDTAFNAAGLDGGTSFTGTTLNHVDLAYARLVGSNFSGARLVNRSSLFFANITDADLREATLTVTEEGESPLRWAEICRTTLPDGSVSHRDCRAPARRGQRRRPARPR